MSEAGSAVRQDGTREYPWVAERPASCGAVIDLARPVRSERRRGFQPPWYTVYVYRCPQCGAETTVRAGAFMGKRPVPGTGGIACSAVRQEVSE